MTKNGFSWGLPVSNSTQAVLSHLYESTQGDFAIRHQLPKRVCEEVGFVLHTRPWQRTSVIAEIFTVHYGRIVVMVRGAKRPMSQYRGILQPFMPLLLSWQGRNELKTLTSAQWLGTMVPPNSRDLMSAFYMNELILSLTQREDPHEGLFRLYLRTLAGFASRQQSRAALLRSFEKDLLRCLGWGIQGIRKAPYYVIDQGVLVGVQHYAGDMPYWTYARVHALQNNEFPRSMARAHRALLRNLIHEHLDGKILKTRLVMKDLQYFEQNTRRDINHANSPVG